MAIRVPLKVVRSITDTATSGSVTYDTILPQDLQSLVVKVWTGATFSGTSPTCDVYVQTSDDGGTTWYDCAHHTQITTAVSNALAKFCVVPAAGAGLNTDLGKGYTGSVASSTIGASSISGLPLLSQLVRIAIKYGGTIGTNSGINVNLLVPDQDNNH
jgi:hypothetical protein